MEIPDLLEPRFREAVDAIDSGNADGLESLLTARPELVRDRLDGGEGYFRRPYLLWFVAENPVRNGRLPPNIAEVTRVILRAARQGRVESLQEQIDYALALVCSGRVPRECGVQRELIDALDDAGADLNGALAPALAHREVAAAERLLERGAALSLTAAVCLRRTDAVARLAPAAGAGERQEALAAAALYGNAGALASLIGLGADVNAYSPPGFHPHGTALHHAVDSGSLDAVRTLVEAGANRGARDRVHEATPLGWAEYLGRAEIAAYLRQKGDRP
jgi:peptide-methionine (S)-S-oxide reductase